MVISGISFDTNLSEKIEDLKTVLTQVGGDWQFNVTDPDSGSLMYAVGNGHAIADWKSLWSKGECLEPTYVPILISSKRVADSAGYIKKVMKFTESNPDFQQKSARLKAAATFENTGRKREKTAESRDKSREEARSKFLMHGQAPMLRTVIQAIKDKYPVNGLRPMASVIRRCGGGDVYVNILMRSFYGHRVFVFLRTLDDKEKTLLARWQEKSLIRNGFTKNEYLEIPLYETKTLAENMETIFAFLDRIAEKKGQK